MQFVCACVWPNRAISKIIAIVTLSAAVLLQFDDNTDLTTKYTHTHIRYARSICLGFRAIAAAHNIV